MADHVPYVAEDDCIACGACEEICPEVFTVNETLGFAQVMNPSGAARRPRFRRRWRPARSNASIGPTNRNRPGIKCGATHEKESL